MISISGIVAAVSVFVVVIVSAVLIKQKYEVEKDFSNRMNNLTKQVNDVNETKAEYDSKQQQNIRGIEADYVRKADQSKNLKTEVLDAKTASFGTATSENGLQITKDNPGALVEKVYNKDQGNRFGVGNFNDTTKVYASAVNNNAKLDLAFAKSDGSFQDALSLKRKGDTSTATLKGDLLINDRYMLSGDNDKYLQLMNREGTTPAGLSMNKLKVGSEADINSAYIGLMGSDLGAVKDMYSLSSTSDQAMFGDTKVMRNLNVKGKTQSVGDVSIGGKLNFGKSTADKTINNSAPKIFMQKDDTGLSMHFDAPAPASHKYFSGLDVVHELDTKGIANHRGLKLGRSNNIVMEAGQTMDDKNIGLSAINFNGMTNGKNILSNEAKSRWRLAVDQRSTNDNMYFDQAKPDGKKTTYMSFSNDNININTNLNINGGSLTQQQDKDSGIWTMSTAGGEGILAYDGASFSFGNKGTKMISLNANGTVGMTGNVDIAKNANIAGAVNTPNIWLENSIGIGKTPAGFVGVMDKAKDLSTLQAKEILSSSGKLGKGGLEVEGDISSRSSLNLDKSAFVKGNANVFGSVTTQNVWLEDNIGLGKTPSGFVGVMDKSKNLTSLEMKEFASSSGKVGKDGLQVEGSIISKSGLNLEKSATVKGDLVVQGNAKIGGAFTLDNGAMLLDAQGNLVLAPNSGMNLQLGKAETGAIFIGPGDTNDIVIGKNKAFFASKGDGNTYINPYQKQQNVMVGSGEMVPRSVVVGEKATDNRIGTDAKMNMIGKSMFPSFEGDVVLRPSAPGKRIMIGTDSDVAQVNIGMKGSTVNISDKMCIQDVCIAKPEMDNIKDISRIKGLPSTSLSADSVNVLSKWTMTDVDNVQKRLPPLFNAEALKLSSADLSYIASIPAISSKPAMGLTETDISNIRTIPKIATAPTMNLTQANIDLINSLSAQDVNNLKQLPSLPATQLSSQDVNNLKTMPALQLTAQDVQTIKMISSRSPAPAF